MKTPEQKILVTGGAGYVGSMLVGHLLQNGFSVRVLDNLKWGGESLANFYNHPNFELHQGDIRNDDALHHALQGITSVVHLAAIVGDPACQKEPSLAKEINLDASIKLFHHAAQAGVQRFLFASTCSNYGKMKNPQISCNEDSELQPISLYADLKVQFEKILLESKNDMCCAALRFATAYGLSPRMRFDLTVNEFTRDATIKKELVVYGEQFWRPYCHTIDLSRACLFMLQSNQKLIDRQAFNVGDDDENYQKRMIVDELKKQIPDFFAKIVQKNEDPRDYKVTFEKIKRLGFSTTKRVPDGIREIRDALDKKVILNPFDSKYSNS